MSETRQAKDRISEYLKAANRGILFDELSKDYLKRAGVLDLLGDVPVPILVDDEGMSTLTIALGMARIVGGDNTFKYAPQYLEYIKRSFGDVSVKILISEGAKAAQAGDYEAACMYFRCALILAPKSVDALYLYGRALKDAYEGEDLDENYVGSFKAECLDVFEILTMLHPDFPMGYYFLGYGYLNLGLYTKAKLTWDTFISLTETAADEGENVKLRKEIFERLESMDGALAVEQAVNYINSGDFQSGKAVLEEYSVRFEQWWPLWYYLGIAETALGNAEAAIKAYKKALKYSPSNIEVMQELCNIYQAIGDEKNFEKYSGKIDIVRKNMAEEQADD